MKKSLLQILSCPVSQKGVALAKDAQLHALNQAIAAGTVSNRSGDTVTEPFAEALVSDNGKFAYPIHDGIPVLLESHSVDLEQLD
ncbi:MAG: Trm112 family protein [Pseudomonadota bacterium]